MNYDFWSRRWSRNETGWHQQEVHPKLKQYWPELGLERNATILVPFCGKSLDLKWLAKRHQKVIGIELVTKPVEEFMQEHYEDYQLQEENSFHIYKAQNLEIWQGDFFEFGDGGFSSIDGIYDRGSLVSLPPDMRKKYGRHICRLSNAQTQILLIVYDYNQDEMNGPPFSVPRDEVEQHFRDDFQIKQLLNKSILEEVDGFRQKGLSSYMDLNIYQLIHR